MKRSEVNKALRELEAMCEKYHCYLPPFCHFTPSEWETKGHEYDEVRDCCLGWDITDYGMGDFDKMGFSLITIRNGHQKMTDKYPKVYAEKLLYLKEGQYSPNHFHWFKTEDIINRGGGNVLIRVYNSHPDESIDYESDVTVHTDGRTYTVPAGTQIRLTPGESIFIQQYLYHDFEVEPGTGPVLLGEVSQCNDDACDPNLRKPLWRSEEEAREQILWSLQQADVVKISDDEVDFLWSCTPEEGADKLLTEFGVSLAMVTLGPKGCLLKTENSACKVNSPKVSPVDTTGAGDIFGGSAVCRLLELDKPIAELTAEDLHYIAAFASTAASLSTETAGGIPSIPRKDAVLAAM